MPLPTSAATSDLWTMLRSVSIENAPPAELHNYLEEDFERFVHTLALADGLSGRALEIGANPYFTSVLLREFTDLDLTLTNSFDPTHSGPGSQRVRYRTLDGVERSVEMAFESLNVETMRFPFADDSFDVVFFCEVIEHLVRDPVHALLEIHRVMKPGAVLVVSTPNAARLENVARLAAGANIYDPYSGYGVYGRHNREYTRHELVMLLGSSGFSVPHHFTVDVHPHRAGNFVDLTKLQPLLIGRLPDLGQYVFCRAVKAGPATEGRPAWLYRSLAEHDLF